MARKAGNRNLAPVRSKGHEIWLVAICLQPFRLSGASKLWEPTGRLDTQELARVRRYWQEPRAGRPQLRGKNRLHKFP